MIRVYLRKKTEKGQTYFAFPESNAVTVVKDVDDPTVISLRKLIEIWRLDDPKKQLEAVKEGIFSNDPEFQRWCGSALFEVWGNSGVSTGFNFSEILTYEEAEAFIRKAFFSPGMTPNGLLMCNSYLEGDQVFRKLPVRYEMFSKALESVSVVNNTVTNPGWKIIKVLLQYPDRADQIYRQLLKLVETGKMHPRMALDYFPELFELGNTQVNKKILRCLEEYVLTDQGDEAIVAASTLNRICREAKDKVVIPEHILDLRNNPEKFVSRPEVIRAVSYEPGDMFKDLGP